jgi:hypothetical protein
MAEKIEFDLKVGSNELQKALSDATTGSKKLGDTISVALGTFGGNIALKGFELLGRAVGNATGFLLDSIDAAAEQEAAFNRLGQSLRATGEFSEEAIQSFSAFASELQRTSVFGDEVVIGQIAIAKSLGATNDEAKQLVQAAANLSATFGGSLEENVFKLGKTLGGVLSKELKVIVPELKSLSEESLKSGDALRIVNERFSGAAAADLDTYAGKTTALGNAYSDLQEELGAFITQSSLVNSVVSVTTGIFQEITQEIINYNNEQKRANGTFVETQDSLNDLSLKYAKVRDEIEKYQQVVDADKSKGLLDSIFTFDNAPLAKERIQSLTVELKKLDQQIAKASELVQSQKETDPENDGADDSTAQEIQKIKELEAQKQAIIAESLANRQALEIELRNQNNILAGEDFLAQQQVELEQATIKAEAAYQNELLINEARLKGKELGLANEIAFQKKSDKISAANTQKEIADAKALIAFERVVQDQKNAITGQGFAFAAAIAKDGSKEQFLIQKAGALAQVAIARGLAIGAIPAQVAPIPDATPLQVIRGAAAAKLTAYANIQAALGAGVIAASAIKGFADGGIIGASMGPDNKVVSVREGEMVLNANQQEKLFSAINSGNLGGGDVVINIDGREIIRVINNQIKSGARIA